MPAAKLLNDQAMQNFIRQGFVKIHTDFSADFHQNVYDRMTSILEKSGKPGNNLLPNIPEIQDVFNHPAVHGALTSVLGPSYYTHPHRYCHVNPPHTPEQNLHKDGYSKRHHRLRWAMAFYYPQDTPVEMGPTGVVGGSQYFNVGPWHGRETPLTGEAGTVVIVHYDLWHRGTFNSGDRKRFMLKFLFARLDEPEAPPWAFGDTARQKSDSPLEGLWESLWNWNRGHLSTATGERSDVAEWAYRLQNGEEVERLEAAYALGAAGEKGVEVAARLMRSEDPVLRRNAGYALCAGGGGPWRRWPNWPAKIRRTRRVPLRSMRSAIWERWRVKRFLWLRRRCETRLSRCGALRRTHWARYRRSMKRRHVVLARR